MLHRRVLLGVVVLGAGLLAGGAGTSAEEAAAPAVGKRTVFLVRHADPAPEPGEQDPKLTADGESRAARLAEDSGCK